MLSLTLKDGSIREYEEGTTFLDVAKSISNKLAKNTYAAIWNGKTCGLTEVIKGDGTLEFVDFSTPQGQSIFRHSSSHVMAQAVKRLWPETKIAIGPSIENGFYYDFDSEHVFTPEDFPVIEKEMEKIIKEDYPIIRHEIPRAEALEMFKAQDEIYKVQLIEDLPEDAIISTYEQGDFTDLCAGPHMASTGLVKNIHILSVAGAYWRGSEKNKMLQRLYATAFPKKADLDAYIQKLEEAKQRDHRKIGKEMGLFMTDNLIGKGLPMFLPKGYIVWQELENYIKEKERKLGYLHVMTPCVGTVDLYKTSGHWDHYKENMFPAMEVEGETFVLRPMNCPHHMMIYANHPHSYRDLPIRIGEIAHDFRFEASGTLKGIERGRHFCQNDAHLFVTPEQIKEEVSRVVDLIFDVYKDFNITDYRCTLSLRDPADKHKYHDDDEMWNKAENSLREVLNQLGIEYTEEIGEAAFYGPKLDVNVRPAVGAEYTLSTCQLDFCLPAKFNLTYVDADGEYKTPVVLHRAILGSLDRFMAYLIEETKGKFPVWLAPTQVKVLPISEKSLEYSQMVTDKLEAAGVRAVLDARNEKIGYKIRESRQIDRAPYMLVIGAKEMEDGTVSVRSRDTDESVVMPVDAFIAQVTEDIKTRK